MAIFNTIGEGGSDTFVDAVYSSDLNDFDNTWGRVTFYLTNADTLHTPYKQGLTQATQGICISISTDGYMSQIWIPYAGQTCYQRFSTPPDYFPAWKTFYTS